MGYVSDKIKADSVERRADYAKFEELLIKAHAAGMLAGNAHTPTPMVVGVAKSLFSNEIDYSKKTFYEPDGVCGFAWVHVITGADRFGKWLLTNKKGRKNYRKGVDIWCSGFNQSMERKEAYCRAYAKVLQAGGIECYAESRMD